MKLLLFFSYWTSTMSSENLCDISTFKITLSISWLSCSTGLRTHLLDQAWSGLTSGLIFLACTHTSLFFLVVEGILISIWFVGCCCCNHATEMEGIEIEWKRMGDREERCLGCGSKGLNGCVAEELVSGLWWVIMPPWQERMREGWVYM